jgi:hypothetical protein
MNTAQSTARSFAAVVSRRGKNADFSLVFSESKIRTQPEGISGNTVTSRDAKAAEPKDR